MSVTVTLDAYVPRTVAVWLDQQPEQRHRVVHGTLASADISGFTKLAERLAGDGKVGGENLTFALNEVFTLLIDEAQRLGGDILKFGGDALLILFDGEDHARRAVVAAARMQDAIESDRAREAAAGIALRMSVGAHTGPIDLFLVGDAHRELIVAGPGATETARLEDSAEAGMVLVDAACVEALGADVVEGDASEERDDGGVVIDRAAASALDVTVPADVDVPAPSGSALPESLRNQVAAIEEIGGEHRRATVGFVRFQGVDERIAAGEVDAVVADLDMLVRRTTEYTQRFGSTLLYSDIYFDGGKLLLSAGSPTSSGHDEESMLRTALAVLGAETELELRSGVNAGPIFSGFLGSPSRRTFTVMGDAVNLAARLMQHAQPDALLATDELVEVAGPVFGSDPVEAFTVKGKSAPIQAGVVSLAQHRGATEAARDDIAFVGRVDVLDTLTRLRTDAVAGRGTAVVVSGGSGSGKSRLVRELLRSPDPSGSIRTIRLRSYPYDELEAYATGHQLARTLIDLAPGASPAETGAALAGHVAEVAPELEPWLPLLAVFAGANVEPTPEVDALDPAFRRDRLHRAVLDYLDVVLPEAAVLVIEDSHHLDDEMTEFVTWMASLVLADRPWLFVLTTRTPVTDIDLTGLTLAIPPLRDDEARELVRLVAASAGTDADELSDDVVGKVAERSGGNPLFLRELAIDAVSRGVGASDALPESVETLLTTRIDQLPAALRLQLRRAAVIGMDFYDDLLRAVGIDTIVPWGPASDFVQLARRGNMRFRQALFRDVAYEGLPYRHRREVHGALADHLIDTDGGDDLATISLHLHFAERWAGSFEWSVRAAGDAASKFANGSAADLYQRALADAARADDGEIDVGERLEAFRSLGEVLNLAGRYSDAIEAFESAEQLAHRSSMPTAVAGFKQKQADLVQRTGRPDEAFEMLQEVLESIRGDTSQEAGEIRATSLYQCAAVRHRQARNDEAIELGHEAADVATRFGAKNVLAQAHMLMHIANVYLGRPDAAEHRDISLPIFEAEGDSVGEGNMLNNLGIEAYYAGRWDDAAAFYERSQEARQRCGDVVGAATSANNLAEVLSDQGHHADARDLLEGALADWTASGFAVGIALASSNLGRAAARSGRHEEAEGLLADGVERLAELGADDMADDARARLVENAVLAQRLDEGADRANQLLASDPLPLVVVVTRRLLGLVYALRGQSTSALEELEASAKVAADEGFEYERVVTELLRAEVRGRNPSDDIDDAVRRMGLVAVPERTLVQSARASIAMGAVEVVDAGLEDDDARVRALASSRLLAEVDPSTIRELAMRATIREVPAGAVLMRQGDPSDGAFLVMSGSFDVTALRPGRGVTSVGSVGRGEWVGEIAMLSDDRRAATVTARRDSQVLELGPQALIAVISSHPAVLRGITSRLVRTLSSDRPDRSPPVSLPSLAFIAIDETDAVTATVVELVDAARSIVPSAQVFPAATSDRVEIQRAEEASDAVVVTAATSGAGLDQIRLACATADALVLVIDGEAARDGSVDQAIRAVVGTRPVDVVVAGDSSHAEGWDGAVRTRLRRRGDDIPARLVRGAWGRSVVAVLGAGGARAFAHLGAAEAWRSAGVSVDAIVASGSGAVVGAALAAGMSTAEAVDACRSVLVPSVRSLGARPSTLALSSGDRLDDRLRELFGDRQFTDLDLDLTLMATDLASGQSVALSDGPVWVAVRASVGTPGIVPPVRRGEQLLVDGGVSDSLPVRVARRVHPGATVLSVDIAVDAGFSTAQLDAAGLVDATADADELTFGRRLVSRWLARRDTRRSSEALTLSTTMRRLSHVRHDAVDAGDIVVAPPVDGFGAQQVDRVDELIRIGRQAARTAIELDAIAALD